MAAQLTVGKLTPHARQAEFVYSDFDRVLVRAGRRGGKTVGLGDKSPQ